jgi:phage baseplate assembly protein V
VAPHAGPGQNDFDWHPLEVGERVAVLSPSGETQNGVVIPAGIYCDENPAPGDKAGLWIRKFQDGGQITYDRDSGEWLVEGMAKITLKVGGCKLEITDDGFAFTGGTVKHDGKNIGKDHEHTEVAPGDGVSGPPQ